MNRNIFAALGLLLLTGCGQPTLNNVTMLPTPPSGKARYSVSGIVMVSEFKEGVTKPYIEEGFAKACPGGLRYLELKESINKRMGISVWVEWGVIIECK